MEEEGWRGVLPPPPPPRDEVKANGKRTSFDHPVCYWGLPPLGSSWAEVE